MVAACGTVTGAAQALHYTPSAVSQQLRTLARDLEVELLVHEGRRVRLTPAARVLLDRADELFATWEQIRGEVALADQRDGGTVRLVGFSTAAAAILPQVAVRVAERGPAYQAQVTEAEPRECFELLLADHADVAVVVATAQAPPSSDPRYELETVVDDPLDLLVPLDHPLADRAAIRLRDLADEQWIMDRPGRPYAELLLAACGDAGFTPSVAHRATEWDTGAAMVSAGLGVSMIPRLAQTPSGYPVARIPLAGDPSPSRRILTGIRAGCRDQPMVALACELIREVAEQVATTDPVSLT